MTESEKTQSAEPVPAKKAAGKPKEKPEVCGIVESVPTEKPSVSGKAAAGRTKDLTVGSPMKLMLGFLIPVVLGELMQQVYSLADTAIVGRCLGVLALGGVGSTGSLNFLVIGFVSGLCSGFSLPVAQAFGAGDEKRLRRFVSGSVYLCIAAALLLLLVLPFTDDVLRLMQVPSEQYDYAYHYIFIIFCGIPATLLYNMTAGVIRSLGDSGTPVLFLTMCSALNIAGDLLTIRVFHMGVAGAALATVISQLLSGIMCFVHMKRKYPILRMAPEDRRPSGTELGTLLGNGVPMGLQFSITAVGAVILQSAVNTLGAVAVSSIALAQKVFHIVNVPYQSMMTASSTFTGQNLGAHKFDRIRQGTTAGCVILFVYWIFHVLFVELLGDRIFLLFVTEEELELVSASAFQCLRIFTWSSCLLIFVNVYRLAIQGMSFSRLALVAGLIEMLARVFTALVLVPNFGFTGACFSNFSAWAAADLFLIPAFFLCLRRRRLEYTSRDEGGSSGEGI